MQLKQAQKIEIRVTTDKNKINYEDIKKGDILEFTNDKLKKIKCLVNENIWYENSLKLLEMEGTRFTLSSTNDINKGIDSINRFTGYKEGIEKMVYMQYIFNISLNLRLLI